MTQTLTLRSDLFEAGAPVSSEERRLHLARPLLGFPSSRSFVLRSLGERFGPFLAMRSLDENGLGFIVVAPGLLFSDYIIEIADADVSLLDLRSSDEAEVLVLVSRHPGSMPTVNLMGPLVINRRTERATQVVLQDAGYGVAVPLDAQSARAH
jgi:flagellar assembly factor FliW